MLSLKISVICAMLAANCVALHAQTVLQPANNQVPESIPSDKLSVVYVAGLDDVKPGINGDLTLSSASLTFSDKSVETSIARDRIVNAYVGDQDTEPWGTTGKIARKIIPYSGGKSSVSLRTRRLIC